MTNTHDDMYNALKEQVQFEIVIPVFLRKINSKD